MPIAKSTLVIITSLAIAITGALPAAAHDTDAGVADTGATDTEMGWSVADTDSDAAEAAAETAVAPETGTMARTLTSAPKYGLQTLPTIRQVGGVDVSHWQWDGRTQPFDWNHWSANNYRFAYVKATESTTYRDTRFASNYNGAYDAGLIRGSYHFARPNATGGAAQAEYFVANGGGWSSDGRTLPGVLDIEHNPSGQMCYNKTPAQNVKWIRDFTERYYALTGRHAVIYTSPSWWETCTGNSTEFAASNPLWIAHYTSGSPRIPGGWKNYTFWQHGVYNYKILQITNSKGKKSDEKYPIDLNEYAGTPSSLKTFATKADGPIIDESGPQPQRIVASCNPKLFKDVGGTTGHCGQISWLASTKVTTGYDDGSYKPTASITRQAMAAFLYRLATGNNKAPACSTAPFNDVSPNHPFCGEINWMKQAGLTTGYDDGGFHPGAQITRQAIAAQLHRLKVEGISCPAGSFPDIADNPFQKEIEWLAGCKVAAGYSDGSFGPGRDVTRGAMATFLFRMISKGYMDSAVI